MIVVLSAQHKADLAPLAALSPEFLAEFGNLTITFLRRGPEESSKKLFAGAARRLGLAAEAVEAAVAALAFLLLEASRLRLSEADFRDSCAPLALPASHDAVLTPLYAAHVPELRAQLGARSLAAPAYAALDWRLDVAVAARTVRDTAVPLFTLRLGVDGGAHVLQTDFTTLRHVAAELEAALESVKAAYVRRVARNI